LGHDATQVKFESKRIGYVPLELHSVQDVLLSRH